jgi:hypothetical protein
MMREGYVTKGVAELLFIRANWADPNTAKEEEEKNPMRAMVPHEFFLSIILLAQSAFPHRRPAAARVAHLITAKLRPHAWWEGP